MNKREQQKYQAQDDAYTMARYQEIMADKARAGRAIKAAKEQASSMQKQADSMKLAAGINRGRVIHKNKK